jgi:ribonuclease HII
MITLGIDEAGRGPMLGPMVMAGVTVTAESLQKLENIGVKDSKLLTPLQRERMFEQVKEIVEDYKIIIVPPKEIDDAVHGKNGLNLNWLEAVKSVEIINSLKADEAILDCPSTNVKAFNDYIKERLKVDTKVRAEHKADLNYTVVGAASILAKVTRDLEIQKIKQELREDVGSGYPADPKTKHFLLKCWNTYPNVFRKSWKSYQKVANEKTQKGLGDF